MWTGQDHLPESSVLVRAVCSKGQAPHHLRGGWGGECQQGDGLARWRRSRGTNLRHSGVSFGTMHYKVDETTARLNKIEATTAPPKPSFEGASCTAPRRLDDATSVASVCNALCLLWTRRRCCWALLHERDLPLASRTHTHTHTRPVRYLSLHAHKGFIQTLPPFPPQNPTPGRSSICVSPSITYSPSRHVLAARWAWAGSHSRHVYSESGAPTPKLADLSNHDWGVTPPAHKSQRVVITNAHEKAVVQREGGSPVRAPPPLAHI